MNKQLSIAKVEKGSFIGKDSTEIKYAKVYFIVPLETSENKIGYDFVGYSIKYDNYKKVADLYSIGKPVECEFEYVERGKYINKKLKSINGVEY